LDWHKLLSKKRLELDISSYSYESGRSEFLKDFDRIVFSSAFRRLQDKTQVFPLPENDFVHTRLTHSLEVSCVGRSLGNLVGQKIIEKDKKLGRKFSQFHFGEIIAAACLAHDIGNPPFGHSGEDAIAEYFRNGNKFKKLINDDKKWTDFIKFEGNAQGFRVITKLQNPGQEGGLRLTYAILAAFTKYPKESFLSSKEKESNIYRKFGFFQSERDFFEEVAEEVGLIRKSNENLWWCRHPLAFLVEAADDICYRIMDLEDGFRLGLLSFTETEDLLVSLIRKKELKNYRQKEENEKIGYLRAKVINELVNKISEAFLRNEDKILNGSFESALISSIPQKEQLEEIKNVSTKKIYSYKSVIERQAAGYEVIGGLLDAFINAVNEMVDSKPSYRCRNILTLLPKQFMGIKGKPDNDIYTRLLKITDFVSGMTDSYAVSLYRRIKGISLPND
jgi:dGTPase